ncbi:alpha/beta hydrolase [Prevotella sp. 10(H)]|uniref:alpha/beta hydrolase n=1 Tax=Prevotella sp. 10(H) TaxID=1158294 RepID=UPI0004A6C57B|nr:alpha/beta hydrolase [Prevotella sp. 10(H)]
MRSFLITFFLICSVVLVAQDKYELKQDIPYISTSETDAYRKERCKLDIYYPVGKKDFPVVVWFHGGGLEVGGKHIPNELKEKGIAVVAVNYRLSPKAQNPAYINDAAASVAWVFKNIASYGGSVNDIYVSGHSAGGYLTLMVGLDKSYMQKYGVDADKIKALVPISGQTNTHYTIRKERNIPQNIPIIDKYAPLNQARAGVPPTLLISGDRHLEMTARYEENLHMEAILKSLGNKEVTMYEVQGFDHGAVGGPGCLLLLDWIKKYSKIK